MAVRRAAVPECLLNTEEAEMAKEMDSVRLKSNPVLSNYNAADCCLCFTAYSLSYLIQEELLHMLSSSKAIAPGFHWHRSRWGCTCPVALKEGKIIKGKAELSVRSVYEGWADHAEQYHYDHTVDILFQNILFYLTVCGYWCLWVLITEYFTSLKACSWVDNQCRYEPFINHYISSSLLMESVLNIAIKCLQLPLYFCFLIPPAFWIKSISCPLKTLCRSSWSSHDGTCSPPCHAHPAECMWLDHHGQERALWVSSWLNIMVQLW